MRAESKQDRQLSTMTMAGFAAAALSAAICPAQPTGVGPCIAELTRPVPPLQNWVWDMIGFDDGSGWALYAAADALHPTSPFPNIGRWDGQSWEPVGTLFGGLLALTVFDDGSGPSLFGGGLTDGPGGTNLGLLVRWDGQEWVNVPTGMHSGNIDALAVYNDGAGSSLYAGGSFTVAGGVTVNNIARWNGQTWSALAGGINGGVSALAAFNEDPAGPALYAGGFFTTAGGEPASNIARWDGQAWSAVGEGTNEIVRILAVFDGGTGPALYASGLFSTPFPKLARWDGLSWSAVGPPVDGVHFALETFDAGGASQPAHLYAIGAFTTIGSLSSPRAARWDGTEWSSFGDFSQEGFGLRMTVTNDGAPALYMGFWGTPNVTFARWGCPPSVCYANCDGSTTAPILNVDDFTCFISEFAAAHGLPHGQQVEHYANCDGSTTAPVLNVNDFTCFINAFAAGCR